MKNLFLLGLMTLLLSSCFGDKKSAIGTTFNDTSIVNKSFSGNKINFANINSPCNYTSKKTLAKLYNTSEKRVLLIGGNAQSKTCTIRIQLSEEEFDYVTGSIHFFEEANKRSDGTTWEDDWQLQQGMSRSAQWVSNMGKGAMYKNAKRELLVKFDEYTMSVIAPGSAFNKTEKALDRDYEKIAVTMAKNTPLF